MERKRSRADIIHDMLLMIQERKGKIKPTHLMYKANLSHKQMKGYLDYLISNKFVEKVEAGDRQMIAITKKGRDFFSRYHQLREFEDTFGIN